MLRIFTTALALLLASFTAIGEESAEETEATQEAEAIEEQGDGIEKPKTMSGMSILGNEEAPKSLVIIPWKSSELGDDISLSDTLDDRARPVDKEVFLRELSFYQIRSGENELRDNE
jgi:hypothetical protein